MENHQRERARDRFERKMEERIRRDMERHRDDMERHRREKEEKQERFKSMDAVVTDFDHPSARENWTELMRLVGSNSKGSIKIDSIWRGNLISHHNHSHRSEHKYDILFPFELRRDNDHGELWIRVNECSRSRLGLNEAWRDGSVLFNNVSWVLLYSMKLGLGRDDEVLSCNIIIDK